MPRVPLLPNVQTNALPTPRVSDAPAGAFGGDIGAALQKVGGDVQQAGAQFGAIQAQAHEEALAVSVTNGVAEFNSRHTKFLHGDLQGTASQAGTSIPGQWGLDFGANGDAPAMPNGYLGLTGEDAVKAGVPVMEASDKARQEIAGTFSNPKARQLFLNQTSGMSEGFKRQVEAHTSQQVGVVKQAAVAGSMDSATRALVDGYADPEVRALQMAAPEGPIRALSVSRADADMKLAAWRQASVATVLDQYAANKDVEGAKAYLEQAKPFLGKQTDEYVRKIAMMGQDGAHEQMSTDIFAKAVKPGTDGWVDEPKALEELAKVPAADREKVGALLLNRIKVAQHVQDVQTKERFDGARTAYQKAGNAIGAVNPNDKAWLQKNAPDDWRGIENWARQDEAEARARRAGRVVPPTPEQEASFGRFRLWAADNPDLAATSDMTDVQKRFGVFTAKQRDEANTALTHYHGAANKPGQGAHLIDTTILDVMGDGGAGILPSKQKNRAEWPDEKTAVFSRAVTVLEEKSLQQRKATGKAPSPDEVRKWAQELVAKGEVPGSGWLFTDKLTRIEADIAGKPFAPLGSHASGTHPEPIPATGSQPAGTHPEPKKDLGARAAELRAQGLNKSAALRQLNSEGY